MHGRNAQVGQKKHVAYIAFNLAKPDFVLDEGDNLDRYNYPKTNY